MRPTISNNIYTYTFPLENTRRGHFYIWAEEAIEQMRWAITSQDEYSIKAMPTGNTHIEEYILITLNGDDVRIECYSSFAGLNALRKKRAILLSFLEALADVSVGHVLHVPDDVAHLSRSNAGQEEVIRNISQSKRFIQLLTPGGDFIITPLLILANLLVFAAMAIGGSDIISPDTNTLVAWGANIKLHTLDGEWWRLFTTCFVHIGFTHLLFNMYGLLFIGLLLEPILGRLRFTMAFLLTGVASSITSLWWNDNVISAGASGAIFGLYGIFATLLLLKFAYPPAMRNGLLLSIAIFIGYNVYSGLNAAVDIAAHLGGLCAGFALGLASYPVFVQKIPAFINKYYQSGTLLIIIALLGFSFKLIPDDELRFQKAMQAFAINEEKALAVFQNPVTDQNETILLHELRENGIVLWNRNLAILQELDNMPPPLVERVALLSKYCELRKSLCATLIKVVKEDNMTRYEHELDRENYQIQEVLQELQRSN